MKAHVFLLVAIAISVAGCKAQSSKTDEIFATLAPGDAEDDDQMAVDRQAPRSGRTVAFRSGFAEAEAEARRDDKLLFVAFETVWCGPCKSMEEWVYTADTFVDASTGFVSVKVDGDDFPDIVKRVTVDDYPTMLLVNPDGTVADRLVGYQGVEAMAAFLTRSAAEGRDVMPADDLDAFWSTVSQTVAAGDFDAYAATYHPDAILVNESTNATYPISRALDGWKEGFENTKAGKMSASVEFRWTRRLRDETTAHETGIFHYVATPEGGAIEESYVHFEALLIRKNGWKMMMEYQKMPASVEEWNQAK